MRSEISRLGWRTLVLTLLTTTIFSAGAFAQSDPDPNSPTPVLLTFSDSPRALAYPQSYLNRVPLAKVTPRAFRTDTQIVIFAQNLTLLEGEGAGAFRVYAIDKKGHQYRFPVSAVTELPDSKRVFAVTLRLTDEIRFWEPLTGEGDVIIYLAWRGLASNSAKLGIGAMGGDIKLQRDMSPMPLEVPGDPVKRPTRPATLDGDPVKRSRTIKVVEPNYVGYRWSGDRLRFLEQATFGPTADLDNRIRRMGIRSWIADQFSSQYPSISNPYPNDPLKPANAPSNCDNDQVTVPDVPATCFRDTYGMYQPQTWFFREAFYSDAQLRHRVAWALAQVWVTSGFDVQQGRHMVEYHRVLSNNAFGNYRDLMKQMTLNPTMGGYLDMAGSTRNNPNENYAREVMQLFSIGLFMLNPDGTFQLDGDGNPIPTYSQDGVNNLTKVLTGWTFCSTAASCPNLAAGTVNYIDPMRLNHNNHDLTAKTLLSYPGAAGTTINACGNCSNPTNEVNIRAYAATSIDTAIDNLFNHPNVGPFVGKILIQHMVASDPTPAYVGRVAAAFNNNGFGVRGDMQAVIRAVLLDPEARGDVKTDPNFGKLREPVLFATNILRAFGVRAASGTGLSDGYIYARGEFSGMAQVPFFSPTVFNFYPPDYGIPGTTLLGPEFAIMTTGTAIQRANFVNRFAFTAIPVPVAAPNAPLGTALNFTDLQAISTADPSGNQLLDELNKRMLHYTMTTAMRSTIQTAVTSYPASDSLNRVRQAIYLIATSSQFQVQR